MPPITVIIMIFLIVSHCVLWRVVWASSESREYFVENAAKWRQAASQELSGYIEYFRSRSNDK